MSVVADISIPADQFALGRLLEVRSGVRVRLESVIPTGETTIPYFWVQSAGAAAVEAALRESALVEEVRVLDELDGETLFRVRWCEDATDFVRTITQSDAVVLDGVCHGDHWSFKLRFEEYDDLSAFYRTVVDSGIPIDLEGVQDPIESTGTTVFDLTVEQREALRIALEEGYFDVPRGATLVDLAEKLGISDSAVSQRIRRGLTKVLSVAVVQGPSDR